MNKILLLLAAFCITACSKEGAGSYCNVIKEVQDYSPYGNPVYQTTALFTYDSKGRITTVKGKGKGLAQYTYYSDKIVLKATDMFNSGLDAVYYLDYARRIVRTAVSEYSCKYNSGGYLVSYRAPYGYNNQINGYTQYYLTYKDGNLVELSTSDLTVSRKKVTFEYFDEPNQDLAGYNSPLYLSGLIGDRESFFLIKAGFWGRQSKNLLKSVDLHQGNSVYVIPYKRAPDGRITGGPGNYVFNYTCP